jgi:hypothetical protein
MPIQDRFYYESNAFCDNIEAFASGNQLHIQVEEPWAGSTETGFGYRCNIDLPKDKAIELANFILRVSK